MSQERPLGTTALQNHYGIFWIPLNIWLVLTDERGKQGKADLFSLWLLTQTNFYLGLKIPSDDSYSNESLPAGYRENQRSCEMVDVVERIVSADKQHVFYLLNVLNTVNIEHSPKITWLKSFPSTETRQGTHNIPVGILSICKLMGMLHWILLSLVSFRNNFFVTSMTGSLSCWSCTMSIQNGQNVDWEFTYNVLFCNSNLAAATWLN